MSAGRSVTVETIIQVVRDASRGIIRDFSEIEYLRNSAKGAEKFSLASESRAASNIQKSLAKIRPAYGCHCYTTKGGDTQKGTDPLRNWIVHVIDGVENFFCAVPHFCTAIALEQKGEITRAVVYDPIRNELFTSEKGQGAWLNNRRMRVSHQKLLHRSVIAVDSFSEVNAVVPKVTQSCSKVRCYGSSLLDFVYVSSGRFDACFSRCKIPHDIGEFFIKESGGRTVFMPSPPPLHIIDVDHSADTSEKEVPLLCAFNSEIFAHDPIFSVSSPTLSIQDTSH